MSASNPSRGDVHVNAPLTNISVAYLQDASNFVADRFFPNIPVMKKSDRYFTFDRGDFNRDEMEERAPGTESAGAGYDIDSTPTYYARVYAFHKDLDDETRANEDNPLNGDRNATQFVTQKALIKRERLFASRYFKPGIWDSGATGVNAAPSGSNFLQWDNASSTPIEQVRAAKRQIQEMTGFKPNKLLLGAKVWDALVDHPDLVDRIKYGQTPGSPAVVNKSAIAALFEIDEILVMEAIVNLAAKGATEDSAFIGGQHALLGFVTPTPGLETPTAGYTFSWSGWFGAQATGHRIKRFRMENLESDRIEIQMAFDQKVIGADLGYFFENAVNDPASA